MIVWRRPRRALLLDRDGVVNVPPPGGFVLDYDRDFAFVPAFVSCVRPFAEAEIPIVVVSNQSCVGRGLISARAAQAAMDRMVRDLASLGIPIEGYAVCPHAPEAGCDCRKPKPGLLLECRQKLALDLGASAFVGDSETDLEAGAAAHCPSFRVDPNDERIYREGFAAAFGLMFGHHPGV